MARIWNRCRTGSRRGNRMPSGYCECRRPAMCYALAKTARMLEFFLYLVSGIGYAFYFDLNLLEAALVAIVLICVWRGWVPQASIRGVWRRWIGFANHKKIAVLSVFVF